MIVFFISTRVNIFGCLDFLLNRRQYWNGSQQKPFFFLFCMHRKFLSSSSAALLFTYQLKLPVYWVCLMCTRLDSKQAINQTNKSYVYWSENYKYIVILISSNRLSTIYTMTAIGVWLSFQIIIYTRAITTSTCNICKLSDGLVFMLWETITTFPRILNNNISIFFLCAQWKCNLKLKYIFKLNAMQRKCI